MASFSRKKVGKARVSIPQDLIVYILSFLCNKRIRIEGNFLDYQGFINEKMSTLQAFVNKRPSLNDTLSVGEKPSMCSFVPCNTSTQGLFPLLQALLCLNVKGSSAMMNTRSVSDRHVKFLPRFLCTINCN